MSGGNVRINYLLAMIFGLIHGMGFANSIRFMLADDQQIGLALLGFNIGLEAGQLLIVSIILTICSLVLKYAKVNRRDWVLFLSAAIFGLSLKMALERLPI